ncbi:MAG: UxaA family hydrolase [Oscillospiraceae bacterium]|nr:UxaA family hydrolase [Oscillospiraceae bacterium]
MNITALKADGKDNVATVFSNEAKAGLSACIWGASGKLEEIRMLSDIPYGHKIALCDLSPGDPIIKYGENIGQASALISKGDYVHIHNMVSLRGRGDLQGGTDR